MSERDHTPEEDVEGGEIAEFVLRKAYVGSTYSLAGQCIDAAPLLFPADKVLKKGEQARYFRNKQLNISAAVTLIQVMGDGEEIIIMTQDAMYLLFPTKDI